MTDFASKFVCSPIVEFCHVLPSGLEITAWVLPTPTNTFPKTTEFNLYDGEIPADVFQLNIGSFCVIAEEDTNNSGERSFTYPIPGEIILILKIEEALETWH